MDLPQLDFWFDFGSTYSYPASQRVRALADAADVSVRFRPFMLGAIFKEQGWSTSPFNIYPAKGRYMWRDLARICAGLGLPLVRPDPFPQNSLLAARIAVAAADQAWCADYCVEIFREAFARGRDISDAAIVRAVLDRLGADESALMDRARSSEIKDTLREETERARALGIFGAPTFVTADGDLFWGNDRLEDALSWARSFVPPADT